MRRGLAAASVARYQRAGRLAQGAAFVRPTPLAFGCAPPPAVGLMAERLTAPLSVQPLKASGRGTPRRLTPRLRRVEQGTALENNVEMK